MPTSSKTVSLYIPVEGLMTLSGASQWFESHFYLTFMIIASRLQLLHFVLRGNS